MRAHVLFAVALAALTAPAGAVEPTAPNRSRTMPEPAAPGTADRNVSFEVRVLKVPVGFSERAGLKGDAVVLSADQLRTALAAVQEHRAATVTQFPKVTVGDGQTARVRAGDTRYFVTSVEATKVRGATMFVPKNRAVELGDSLTIGGSVSADGKCVRVAGGLTRVRVEGNVELVPVVTQITPVFEGGSQGAPVPVTQYLEVPDVRTEKAEKTATVPAGSALVLGGWKETEPVPAPAAKGKLSLKRENKEKPAEYEVVVIATVHVLRDEPEPAR